MRLRRSLCEATASGVPAAYTAVGCIWRSVPSADLAVAAELEVLEDRERLRQRDVHALE